MKTKEEKKAAKKAKKAAKKAAAETTTQEPVTNPGVHFQPETDGKNVYQQILTLDKAIRLETTPNEMDYELMTAMGGILFKKGTSVTPGKGRIYVYLDGQKVAIDQLKRDAREFIKTPAGKKAGDTASGDQDEEQGPSPKHLKAEYKKKHILNTLKDLQCFDKATIKAIKKDITEKAITGGVLINVMDDAVQKEVSLSIINQVMEALNS